MRLPFVALHSEMWKLIKRNQGVIPCSHKLSHTIISNPQLCWGQHHSAMIYSLAYWSSWFYHKGFYPASPTCLMLSVPYEYYIGSVISSDLLRILWLKFIQQTVWPAKTRVHAVISVVDSGLPLYSLCLLFVDQQRACLEPKLHVSNQSATNYRLSPWNDGWTLISLHVAAQASVASDACSIFRWFLSFMHRKGCLY